MLESSTYFTKPYMLSVDTTGETRPIEHGKRWERSFVDSATCLAGSKGLTSV